MEYKEALELQQQAEEIINREYYNRKHVLELTHNMAVQGLIGKYFVENASGAEDDAFQVYRVIRKGWHDERVFVHTIGYWHKGHYEIGYTEWNYEIFGKIRRGFIKEMSKKDYSRRLKDFLNRVGDLEHLTRTKKETTHS